MMRFWLIDWNLTPASSYSMNGVVPQMPHTLRVRGSNEVRPVRNDRTIIPTQQLICATGPAGAIPMPAGYDADLDNLLLSYCHDAYMPVELLRRDDVDLVLNMPHHDLEKPALVGRLQDLVARQWLEVSLPAGNALPPDEGVRVLAPMLDLSKEQAREICLSLTPAGGRAWEAFAKPRWWAFISDEIAEVVDGRVHLVYRSPLRKTLEAFGDMITYTTILHGNPRRFTNLGSWQPARMAWKAFRRGCELRIDTGASPDSRVGECYQSNCLSDVSPGLQDIVMRALWIWDLPFRLALRELRGRLTRSPSG